MSKNVSTCRRGAGQLSVRSVAGTLLALALAGCALVVCDPLAIIVAKKEEYGRLDTVPRGFGTTATGRLEEKQEPALVREYWVHSERGSRYRVSADQYKAAEVDRPLRVCR